MTGGLSVFISYSRADTTSVDTIEEELKSRGYSTWMDRRKLKGGENFARVIDAQIVQHDIFLIVVSPTAMKSKWVRKEIDSAFRLGKYIVPVLILGSVKVLPKHLKSIYYVDLVQSFSAGMTELFNALGKRQQQMLEQAAQEIVGLQGEIAQTRKVIGSGGCVETTVRWGIYLGATMWITVLISAVLNTIVSSIYRIATTGQMVIWQEINPASEIGTSAGSILYGVVTLVSFGLAAWAAYELVFGSRKRLHTRLGMLEGRLGEIKHLQARLNA